jgi:hypothetical protein
MKKNFTSIDLLNFRNPDDPKPSDDSSDPKPKLG